MPRISDKQQVENLIEMFSLRKKQFVRVDKRLMPKLQHELLLNYPKAKFTFFGLGGGTGFNCMRSSSASTFKKGNRCKGCNYPVQSPDTYCGECLCEDDCGY
jgi:hypothetical protein